MSIYTNAKYVADMVDGSTTETMIAVSCNIDGGPNAMVSIDPDNTHYAEILKQVAAGDLTIADAD
jgi:hypothetical protein|tara:strand:- start:76 stop:270 length:195 start_codon:yes stop_codon:yes gene_type:complete